MHDKLDLLRRQFAIEPDPLLEQKIRLLERRIGLRPKNIYCKKTKDKGSVICCFLIFDPNKEIQATFCSCCHWFVDNINVGTQNAFNLIIKDQNNKIHLNHFFFQGMTNFKLHQPMFFKKEVDLFFEINSRDDFMFHPTITLQVT